MKQASLSCRLKEQNTFVGKLPLERVNKGIRAIAINEDIMKLPIHDTTVLRVAFKLRSLLNALIDYLILPSA